MYEIANFYGCGDLGRINGTNVEVQVEPPSPEVISIPSSPLTEIVEDESELDAGVRLDPEDSMYRAKSAKNRVEAPAPSIIRTRASARKKVTEEVPSVKRSRFKSRSGGGVSDSESDEAKGPKPKRPRLSPAKKRVKTPPAQDIEDDPPSPMQVDDALSEATASPVAQEHEVDEQEEEQEDQTKATSEEGQEEAEDEEDEEETVGEENNGRLIADVAMDVDAVESGKRGSSQVTEEEDEAETDPSSDDDGESVSSRAPAEPLPEPEAYDTDDSFINNNSELSIYESDNLDGLVGGQDVAARPAAGKDIGAHLDPASDSDSEDDTPLSGLKAKSFSKAPIKPVSARAPSSNKSKKDVYKELVDDSSSQTKPMSKAPKQKLAVDVEQSVDEAAAVSRVTPRPRPVKKSEPATLKSTRAKQLGSSPAVDDTLKALRGSKSTASSTRRRKATVEEAEDVDAPKSPLPPPKPSSKPLPKSGAASSSKSSKACAKPPKVTVEEVEDVDAPKSPRLSPKHSSKVLPKSETSSKASKARANLVVPGATRAKRSFKSMLGGSTPGVAPYGAKETLLDDLTWSRVQKLPLKCEVTDINLQYPLLQEYYKGLPNLVAGAFQAWSDARGPGCTLFSNWAKVCSEMDFDSCLSAMTFNSDKDMYNLARVSPLDVVTRELPNVKNHFVMYTRDYEPVIAVSAVCVTESSVLGVPSVGGMQHKRLSGILHSQNWERVVAFVCMVFRHKLLSAQVFRDAIQFSTRTVDSGNKTPSSSPKKRNALDSGVRSPATATKSNSVQVPLSERYTLVFEETIPVYDCRDIEVDFSKDLRKLETFPRWVDKEIPLDSFAVVGYTMSVYWANESKGWSVSFNIQWAMILGVPDDA